MDGAAVTLREERLASATRAEHLERLLSTAEVGPCTGPALI